MATGPKIVHKQFNSPMGLYSRQNIQETLNKHIHTLDNGSVGIDFTNPNTDKPGNLANSAVLRMLEEEEQNRRGYPSQKKVVWPPGPETNGYHSSQSPAAYAQHSPQNYQQTQQQYQPQNTYQNQQNQYQNQQNQHQQQSQQNQVPRYHANYLNQQQQSAYSEGKKQETTGLSKLIPFGPGVSACQPAPYRQSPLSPPAQRQPSHWAPAPAAPVSPQAYSQPAYDQYPPSYSPQPQYQSQFSPQGSSQREREPPASIITLRPQPPIHQKPSPVFASQPATTSFKGGVNMRGDQKWPPQSVREAVEAENEARRQLAKGPACRPRKVRKDYTQFFAQNALNHNYPGYRVPPGTQHYEEHSGRSSY